MKTVTINVKNIEGLKLPTQANPDDAGYDVFAMSDPKIKGTVALGGSNEKEWVYSDIQYIEYDTGLQISPLDYIEYTRLETFSSLVKKHKHWTQVFPRSSISKYNLLMCNSFATIDNGYRGNILLRYKYIFQPKDMFPLFDNNGELTGFGIRIDWNKIYKVGDAIAQIRPVENVGIQWKVVDELDQTTRGDGGFGSSGNNSSS